MSPTPLEPGDLEFEHVGTMTCGDRLLVCDVEYLPPRFANSMQGKVSLAPEIEVRPGVWQVLLAFDSNELEAYAHADPDGEHDHDHTGPAPKFVLLTHDSELESETPLDEADAIALVRVDSGRITAIDVELRDDLDIQTAVLEAPRDQVPCMLRPLEPDGSPASADTAPRGALIDLDAGGVFELYASPTRPHTVLFLAL
jgi:hypothetical protein